MPHSLEFTDPLTGAYSRALLNSHLHDEVERSQRYSLAFTLLLLDLDHFKSINDAFGHARGDAVLVEFVARMGQMIRGSDLLFRYGGDEFVILLPHTAKDQAIRLAERLLERVCSNPFGDSPPLSLSLSMGVASYPEDGQTPEALFECADRRHYGAKRAGRGRVMAEDPLGEEGLSFDAFSRLIERDRAMQKANRFLDRLLDSKRGALIITGTRGAGKSHFQSEICKAARLQGFGVFAMRGLPALRTRQYAALSEALKQWDGLPPANAGTSALSAAFGRLVVEKGYLGLLLAVDNLPELDSATLELLRALLFTSDIPVLGLVCTTGPESFLRVSHLNPHLEEVIELEPFTPDGVHVLLRGVLRWEAPQPFADWLYQETGGLPGFLQKGLTYLVEKDVLTHTTTGWDLKSDYAEIPLGEQAGFRLKMTPTNLPVNLTSFVGREAEIQQVKELIETQALLSLVGPGGIGKTRLAIQASAESADRFRHGVRFTSLASVNATEFLVPAIASAVDFSLQGAQSPKTQLLNYLREKEMLLVLDNFEHLVEGAGLVADILHACPSVKVLVTSRERLNLEEEFVLPLQVFDLPTEDSAATVESYSAVQLFLQRARQAQPGFTLEEADKPVVAAICRLVGGMPLGIELAAAWVKALDCSEISQEIKRNLDFLTSNLRNVPERHRSMRAVFDSSWNLLAEAERRGLMRLTVFQAGFRREAAEAVTSDQLSVTSDQSSVTGRQPVASRGELTRQTLGLLSALVDKSLIQMSPSGRYSLHNLVAQYAGEKLDESTEEREQVQTSHGRYFTGFLHQRFARLNDSGQAKALVEIGQEIENVRAAWQWAVGGRHIEAIGQCLEGLALFYTIRGWYQEGEAAFGQAAAALEPTSSSSELVFGNILAQQGACCYYLGRYDQAVILLEKSLESLRTVGGPRDKILAQYYLGGVAIRRGEYARAEAFALECASLANASGSPLWVARALTMRGSIATSIGKNSDAKGYLQESLAIIKEIGEKRSVALALNNLGTILRQMGELAEARPYFEESLVIAREIGYRQAIALSLSNLGQLAYVLGDSARAWGYFQESLVIARELGSRLLIISNLIYLGDAAIQLGEYAASRGYFKDALKLSLEIRAIPAVLLVLVGMADLFSRQDGGLEHAAELVLHPLHHPATERADRDRAERLRDTLKAALAEPVFDSLTARSRACALVDVVEEILGVTLPESQRAMLQG